MAEPERVDLRVGACFPYAPVTNQGEAQSCVAHSFAMALNCLKSNANLFNFPASRAALASLDSIFTEALSVSPDKRRGTSFDAVVRSALKAHGEDLGLLGWRVVALLNSAAQCKQRLRLGAPVVAGYQVNARIARFHSDARVCEAHGFLLPSFAAAPEAESAHAVLLVGFDDAIGCFIARNSWGEAWGVRGHFLVRYRDLEDPAFFTDLVSFARAEEATRAPRGGRSS